MNGDSAIGAAVSGLLGTLFALVFVLVLAFGALRLLRSWQQRSSTGNPLDGNLRFVRALPVGPRERIVIVEVDGERMLVGVSAGSVTLLTRLAPPARAEEIAPQ